MRALLTPLYRITDKLEVIRRKDGVKVAQLSKNANHIRFLEGDKGILCEVLPAYLRWCFLDQKDAHLSFDATCRNFLEQEPLDAQGGLTRETWMRKRFLEGCEGQEQSVQESPLVLVTAAALIDSEGRILLAQRPAHKAMGGLWEFPGGKVEPGESPELALIRELHEELGISVKNSCLAPLTFASHAYADFHLLMPLFAIRIWEGDLTPREGQTLAWAALSELRNYPMPPADLPLIPMLFDLL